MKQEEMLRRIQILDFAIQEAALFLNSHPADQQAMAYYRQVQQESMKMTAAYEKQFGPLTNKSAQGKVWEYSKGPWPWEGEK